MSPDCNPDHRDRRNRCPGVLLGLKLAPPPFHPHAIGQSKSHAQTSAHSGTEGKAKKTGSIDSSTTIGYLYHSHFRYRILQIEMLSVMIHPFISSSIYLFLLLLKTILFQVILPNLPEQTFPIWPRLKGSHSLYCERDRLINTSLQHGTAALKEVSTRC